MILLTKLDNKQVLINLENIKFIESIPDTLILFTNGESLIVKETLDQVTHSVVAFKSAILRQIEQSQPEAELSGI